MANNNEKGADLMMKVPAGHVSYLTFMKHAEKVTRNARASRPVLKGVNHADGYVEVTDSHRLYRASDIYEGEAKLIAPKTGEVIEEKYPELSRLIPDATSAVASAEIDVSNAYEAVRAIEIADKQARKRAMKISAIDGGIEFETVKGADFQVVYADGEGQADADVHAYVDTRYMKELLHTLKDAKVEKVRLEIHGTLRPLVFRVGNFEGLIVPIRYD